MHKRQRAIAVAERRAKVSALYLAGKNQVAIAAELEINQSTVSTDLKTLREQWRAEAGEQTDAWFAQELAKLARVEQEAWEQWERSKQDEVVRTEETTEDGFKTSVRTRGQCGDPRYLSEVQKVIVQRRELLGLDAPKRTELSGPGGGPIGLRAVRAEDLSDDELAEIIARHEQRQGESDGHGSHLRIAPPEEGPDPAA